jgi:hypothetical protein
MRARAVLIALMLLGACGGDDVPSTLPLGTWGGEGAGLIVSADAVHVHLGCTRGDIDGRIAIGAGGAFEATGRHNVDAFPVDLEIFHPARYSGRLHGDDRLTIEVTLTDTGQHLGPAEAFLGREPRLGPCPICR